ncbi:hypothetical protein [Citrobacter youngae]|uniref:hypothetical protein n=1 Tax=Citrobacter youngae TaxID=133448 RepID=UPI0019174515|nr:hypothetical protein [Citrobacter youngae]MBK6260611.1 hypothetical protein [Citrobacter youngae]
MSVKRYEANGSSSVFEDANGSLVDYEDYSALEQKLTNMALQLANAESKCRELASEVSELNECKNLLEKIKSTSCHVDTSKDAFIPNSLDAWGRPVPQYLPYDFSGNPGASATQYCNGWNDAGCYWLNHVKYLQECIRINSSLPEAAK